jgi:hypothetical protein
LAPEEGALTRSNVSDLVTRFYRHLAQCRGCFGVVHLRWPSTEQIACPTGKRLRLAFERLSFRWDDP